MCVYTTLYNFARTFTPFFSSVFFRFFPFFREGVVRVVCHTMDWLYSMCEHIIHYHRTVVISFHASWHDNDLNETQNNSTTTRHLHFVNGYIDSIASNNLSIGVHDSWLWLDRWQVECVVSCSLKIKQVYTSAHTIRLGWNIKLNWFIPSWRPYTHCKAQHGLLAGKKKESFRNTRREGGGTGRRSLVTWKPSTERT